MNSSNSNKAMVHHESGFSLSRQGGPKSDSAVGAVPTVRRWGPKKVQAAVGMLPGGCFIGHVGPASAQMFDSMSCDPVSSSFLRHKL